MFSFIIIKKRKRKKTKSSTRLMTFAFDFFPAKITMIAVELKANSTKQKRTVILFLSRLLCFHLYLINFGCMSLIKKGKRKFLTISQRGFIFKSLKNEI